MKRKILLIDDDSNILQAFKRQLRSDFDIVTALGGKAALELFNTPEEFAVVVSDMQMPQMNGIDVLQEIQKISPNTVRIMLTGNADQATATRAVNEGQIFRFLNKPCSADEFTNALNGAVEQYRLLTLEKDLLQNTLSGSVKLLTDILSMVDPNSFGKMTKFRKLIREVSSKLGIKNPWDIELAAMLSNIGVVALPPAITSKLAQNVILTEEEKHLVAQIPETGRTLLSNIPRLEKVASIVLYQNKRFDGSGFPTDEIKGKDIPTGARILKLVKDFYDLDAHQAPMSERISRLYTRREWYDQEILKALEAVLIPASDVSQKAETNIFEVNLNQLCAGQILLANVHSSDGVLLITAGSALTQAMIERIKNYSKLIGVQGPFKVNCYVPSVDS